MRLIPVITFLVLLVFLAIGIGNSDQVHAPKTSHIVGKKLPDLQLNPVKPSPEFEASTDEVMLINLFASWCTPCIAELPELAILAAINNVKLVGIAWHDTPDDLAKWLKKYNAPYEATYVDSDNQTGVKLGIRGIPETFIIDKHGIVRLHHVGPIDKTTRKEIVEPLLRELTL